MQAKDVIHYVPGPTHAAPWATMPGLDRSAVGHAMQKLALVQAALAGARAQVACFHIEIKGRKRGYKCTFWRGDAETGFDIADGTSELTHEILSEICGALAPLARDLAARWPERARPSTIGMACDGHRIVFNADHPSCVGEAWLSQHLSGRSPGTIIADDHKGGMLSRICP